MGADELSPMSETHACWERDGFTVTADPARIDRAAVHAFLSGCYWAEGIPRATVDRSIDGSLCFALLKGEEQVGFARVITDRATFGYVADVYIVKEFRGLGLAKWLMECVVAHPDLAKCRRLMLATRDAQELYSRSGFKPLAHPEHHRAGMEHRASYLVHADDVRDQLDWTPEHSRRARGFATYAALRELGRAGVAELVERNSRQARELVTRIGALPHARAVAVSEINQGLVRFHDPAPGATDMDHDRRTDAVIAAINASGEAYFTGTTWRGTRCMRVSVSNWRTTAADVDRAVAAAAAASAG